MASASRPSWRIKSSTTVERKQDIGASLRPATRAGTVWLFSQCSAYGSSRASYSGQWPARLGNGARGELHLVCK